MEGYLPAVRMDANDMRGGRDFILPVKYVDRGGTPITPLGKSMLPGLLVGDANMVAVNVVKEGGVSRVSITGLRMIDDRDEAREIMRRDLDSRKQELASRRQETAAQSSGQLLSINNVYVLHNPRMYDGQLYFDAWIDPVREQNLSHYQFWNSEVSNRGAFLNRLDRVPEMMSKTEFVAAIGDQNIPVFESPNAMGWQTTFVNRPLEILVPGMVSFAFLMSWLSVSVSRAKSGRAI